jgi:hypothetical protein
VDLRDGGLGLELRGLLEHDHDGLGLYEGGRALVFESGGDRRLVGRAHQCLVQVALGQRHGLLRLAHGRRRHLEGRAQLVHLGLGYDLLAVQLSTALQVAADLLSLGACAVELGFRLTEAQLVGLRVDAEEGIPGGDPVALLDEDLGEPAAHLGADPALAPRQQTSGGGDPLEDRSSTDERRVHGDDGLGCGLCRGALGLRTGARSAVAARAQETDQCKCSEPYSPSWTH